MFDRSLEILFSTLQSIDSNSTSIYSSPSLAHATMIMRYMFQKELQEERKKMVEEVTEQVLNRLSLAADTQQAITQIDSLNKALERLEK